MITTEERKHGSAEKIKKKMIATIGFNFFSFLFLFLQPPAYILQSPAGKPQSFGLSFKGLQMTAAPVRAPAISFREILYPFPPMPISQPQAFDEAGRLKTEFDRWTTVFSAQSDLQIDWNLLLFEKYNTRLLEDFLAFDLPVEEQLNHLKKRLKEKK